MAIAKGANVIVNRGGSERPGVVLRETAPHVVRGLNPGEEEVTKRYEVQMPAHGDYPAYTGVFSEYELKSIPHDSRGRHST